MSSPLLETEVVVVGGGVVGMACARALAQAGSDVVVLERHEGAGRETTSRNSEVLHAGIYYPKGSLKAELCLRGLELVYPLCERLGVAHRRCGKLIVAVEDDERAALEALEQRALQAGARELSPLGRDEIARRAPAVRAVAALWSARTGIVDSHELTKALEAEARAAGAEVLYRSELCAVEPRSGDAREGYVLTVRQRDGVHDEIAAGALINSAGLSADAVAAMCGVDAYALHPCRGDYFRISGAPATIDTLVYPLPRPELVGLGVHLTIDLAGGLRLGPDTRYVAREAMHGDVDERKAEAFAAGARRYLPWLRAEMLRPDTYGVRPKLAGPGDRWHDFVVTREDARGHPRLCNLVGIESPGLTAAMAIGERVQRLLAA